MAALDMVAQAAVVCETSSRHATVGCIGMLGGVASEVIRTANSS